MDAWPVALDWRPSTALLPRSTGRRAVEDSQLCTMRLWRTNSHARPIRSSRLLGSRSWAILFFKGPRPPSLTGNFTGSLEKQFGDGQPNGPSWSLVWTGTRSSARTPQWQPARHYGSPKEWNGSEQTACGSYRN